VIERRVRHHGVEGAIREWQRANVRDDDLEIRISLARRRGDRRRDIDANDVRGTSAQRGVQPAADELVEQIGLQHPAHAGGRHPAFDQHRVDHVALHSP
jgi:hypothetical protein